MASSILPLFCQLRCTGPMPTVEAINWVAVRQCCLLSGDGIPGYTDPDTRTRSRAACRASVASRGCEQPPRRMLCVRSAEIRNRSLATASQKETSNEHEPLLAVPPYTNESFHCEGGSRSGQTTTICDSESVFSDQGLHPVQEDLVKRLRTSARGCRLSAPLMLFVLFCGSGARSGSFAQTQLATSSTTSPKAQQLSSESQDWLRNAINGGNLPELRWPDFSDYSKHVKKFYEFNGDSFWWGPGNGAYPTSTTGDRADAPGRRKGTLLGRL